MTSVEYTSDLHVVFLRCTTEVCSQLVNKGNVGVRSSLNIEVNTVKDSSAEWSG